MWAQITLRAWVREISGAPTRDCISGETFLGFIMPRSSPLPVEACLEAVARVGVRATRRWTGLGQGEAVKLKYGTANDVVSPERKVEIRPLDIAMSYAVCSAQRDNAKKGVWLWKKSGFCFCVSARKCFLVWYNIFEPALNHCRTTLLPYWNYFDTLFTFFYLSRGGLWLKICLDWFLLFFSSKI